MPSLDWIRPVLRWGLREADPVREAQRENYDELRLRRNWYRATARHIFAEMDPVIDVVLQMAVDYDRLQKGIAEVGRQSGAKETKIEATMDGLPVSQYLQFIDHVAKTMADRWLVTDVALDLDKNGRWYPTITRRRGLPGQYEYRKEFYDATPFSWLRLSRMLTANAPADIEESVTEKATEENHGPPYHYVLSAGAYSDYSVAGLVVSDVRLDIRAIASAYRVHMARNAPEDWKIRHDAGRHSWHSFEDSKFFDWLRENYPVRPVEFVELNVDRAGLSTPNVSNDENLQWWEGEYMLIDGVRTAVLFNIRERPNGED